MTDNSNPIDFRQLFANVKARQQGTGTSKPSNRRDLLPASPVITWFQGQDEEQHIEILKDGIAPPVFQGMEYAFRSGEMPIFLHGKQGRGKSYGAYYFARRCYPRAGGKHILWYRSPRDLQTAMIDARGKTVAEFREASVVVLDNFGATSAAVSDFLSDELIGLIDCRAFRPMIVCSNLSPGEIAIALTPPLVSRLLGGTLVEYTGPDRRVQKYSAPPAKE